jgi:hypothetical protein
MVFIVRSDESLHLLRRKPGIGLGNINRWYVKGWKNVEARFPYRQKGK